MTTPRPTKVSQLRAAMKADNWRLAISIASKFQELGDARDAVLRAQDAHTNPRFQKQLGKDPAALIEDGKRALIRRYGEP